MTRFFLTLFVLGLTFLTSWSSADGQGGNLALRSYKISGTLYDDGQVVGKPTVTLRHGEPAIVTSTAGAGYSMRLVATELAESQFGRRLSVTSEIYVRFANQWRLVSKPTLTIPIGTSASYELRAAARRDKPTGFPFKVEMSVADHTPSVAQLRGFQKNACSERKEAAWRDMVANKPLIYKAQLPPDNDDKFQKCCTSGNLTCCGQPGTCCADGLTGNACCVG